MREMIAILAASLVGGCASPSDQPASCRGPLRPANPYGSVLANPTSAAAPKSALSEPVASSKASGQGLKPRPRKGVWP